MRSQPAIHQHLTGKTPIVTWSNPVVKKELRLVCIDDILIMGPTIVEQLSTLDKVLQKLGVAGLSLNKPNFPSYYPALNIWGTLFIRLDYTQQR